MSDRIWWAAAVPWDDPGDEVQYPGPHCKFYNTGPCPWRDGERITLGCAARLTGIGWESLAEISAKWKVRVGYLPGCNDKVVPPVRWQWHWHVTAVPIGDGRLLVDLDKSLPNGWEKVAEPHYEPCDWITCEFVTASVAAMILGRDKSECKSISKRWCVIVEWHATPLAP